MENVYVSLVDLEVVYKQTTPYTKYSDIYISDVDVEIIHKYVPIVDSVASYTYHFAGKVYEGTNLVPRSIYAFSEATYGLVAKSSSDTNGDFTIPTTTSGTCFLVCLSNNVTYDHLIAAKVVPLI